MVINRVNWCTTRQYRSTCSLDMFVGKWKPTRARFSHKLGDFEVGKLVNSLWTTLNSLDTSNEVGFGLPLYLQLGRHSLAANDHGCFVTKVFASKRLP